MAVAVPEATGAAVPFLGVHPSHGRGDGLRRRGFRIPHKASKVLVQTKAALSKHVKKLSKHAEEVEHLVNKVTYCMGVLSFGFFCFILGSRPYTVPHLYALFFCVAAPLRWAYYKSKKWHYYLLDFCYYANVILVAYLVFFPKNEKLFLLCFAFSEGPLAWALMVWRCSLVFSSVDKIVSVLIHLLPGTVLFIIRWWDPVTFPAHSAEDTGPFPPWPQVPSTAFLCAWMIALPLLIYSIWQGLYYLIVEVLRRNRFSRDPEVMTSFRELSKKSEKMNSFWWRLSGVCGDAHRVHFFLLFQAGFTVWTIALTVPMFRSYHLHAAFQFFKVAAAIWNGGSFFFDVMPRQVHAKAERRRAAKVAPEEADLVPHAPSVVHQQEQRHENCHDRLSLGPPGTAGMKEQPADLSMSDDSEEEDVWEEVELQ